MNIRSLFTCFFLFFFAGAVSGCIRPPEKKFEGAGSRVVELESETLPSHLTVFPPEPSGRKFPLLLVLHGRGGRGDDYLKVWKDEADRRGFMILAPTRMRGYRNDEADLEELYQRVEEVWRRYPVDRGKVFLAGVSSGALIARWMLVNRPSFWKGVILVASPSGERWTEAADVTAFPPILFVHGGKDNQYPLEEIVERVEVLTKRGVDATLFSYPDAGHEQRPEWTPRIFDWIKGKMDS